MHLKSVTLKGFKSFAQPTTFAFEPGVTCIVGPNGSGKSNVVDALAWVMGEQGAKTLRGGKMEDVIFAGTATRGPLGRAEVQLTIDNADGALPIEYAEVTISRTLFRNGASEYAINGDVCRLLDVQELLSDSGLGREMHVIVGQGRLDTVLQASPEDRRGFIEEAAGILKHRRRKEKTLRKLEAMETNLTRLSDLAGEIRRQLKPLGRQAEIAREAATIAAIVRDAKARLLADEVVALRAALADHARSERERHTERMVLQDQSANLRARIEGLEREQGSEVVDEARRVSFALEQVQERLRGLFTLANQRLALLGSRRRGRRQRCDRDPGDDRRSARRDPADLRRARRRPRCRRSPHPGTSCARAPSSMRSTPTSPRRALWSRSMTCASRHCAAAPRPRHPLSPPFAAACCDSRTRWMPRTRAAPRPSRRWRGSTHRSHPRVRPPSTRRRTRPRSGRSAPPRPTSKRSASGCTPRSARPTP